MVGWFFFISMIDCMTDKDQIHFHWFWFQNVKSGSLRPVTVPPSSLTRGDYFTFFSLYLCVKEGFYLCSYLVTLDFPWTLLKGSISWISCPSVCYLDWILKFNTCYSYASCFLLHVLLLNEFLYFFPFVPCLVATVIGELGWLLKKEILDVLIKQKESIPPYA